jgi:hypothetical protein
MTDLTGDLRVLTSPPNHDYSYLDTETEVSSVRKAMMVLALFGIGAFMWGCIEDIGSTNNSSPKVWFTDGPREGREVFQNSIDFAWQASDLDDDLGMGTVYVSVTPVRVGGIEISPAELLNGPVRVYENIYRLGPIPDTTYKFSVTVRDGRGGSTTADRTFKVLFDDMFPVVDSVWCPDQKPTNPAFEFTFSIFAHDVALNPASASPEESLTYWYRFVVPGGGTTIEMPDFKRDYKTFATFIDGQTYRGKYVYRAKVRDRAGNVTPEWVCTFDITGPK